MSLTRTRAAALLVSLAACAQTRQNQPPPAAVGPLGRTHAPEPTASDITARDLMTRLYIFADDSMQGRRAGSPGANRGEAYIERELRRMGLQPAGDDGTFFQRVPIVSRGFAETARLVADGGVSLTYGTDFLPSLTRGTPRSLDGAVVIYGGTWGAGAGPLTAAQVRGHVVLYTVPAGATGFATLPRMGPGTPWGEASGVALVNLDQATAGNRRSLQASTLGLGAATMTPDTPLPMYLTRAAAEALLGRPLDGAPVGTMGRAIRGTVAPVETATGARNVAAVLPGSDAALRGQYVALGAHSDHVGVRPVAVDHDSLRAFNREEWVQRGMVAGAPALSADRRAAIRVNMDSLRRARGGTRLDSISNGADDDGSGSMAVLEIAEAMSRAPSRPRRSVLFVWHTGEELGLLGARWFTDHPTVPRDSIVAQLNIDMIGRGTARDTRGGGPAYVGLVGSRRLSTQLGDLVEAVNRERPSPLAFDYALDADGHAENIYCRSDHYMYARYGIPVTFFFTGLHEDYHQVTDEPQYIDYPHYAEITRYIHDLTRRVADRPERFVVDKARPDPGAACRQ